MKREIDAETTPSLLVRMRDHDDGNAWKQFVEVYSPLIYGFCRSRRMQPTDASDITQEVLLRVSKAISTFEYDRSAGLFRDWLARIVINELRRYATKRKLPSASEVELSKQISTEQSHWNDHFQSYVLAAALDQTKPYFSAQVWELFQANWVEQKSASDVAKELGVPVDQVYVARSRVLKRLRIEVAVLADDSLI